jgi:hypothetical protein
MRVLVQGYYYKLNTHVRTRSSLRKRRVMLTVRQFAVQHFIRKNTVAHLEHTNNNSRIT